VDETSPVALTAMSSPLTRADVVHVAGLARIALTDTEIDQYLVDLGGILGHFSDIASVNTEGILPTAHPLGLTNVFRPDVVRPSLNREEVLAMAPLAEDDRFRVPKILGES
jgi:aspartyl-tRNA(Asn)/glutamyl-tRNA(Gln) amidotransferase subunit C